MQSRTTETIRTSIAGERSAWRVGVATTVTTTGRKMTHPGVGACEMTRTVG
jgi:hypothetical protein